MYIPKEIIGYILGYLGREKFKYSIICKEWNIVLQNFWKWSTHVSMITYLRFHDNNRIIKRLKTKKIIVDRLYNPTNENHGKKIQFILYKKRTLKYINERVFI